MKMRVDASVLMKDVEVNLSRKDRDRLVGEYLASLGCDKIVDLAMSAWRKRRGVADNWCIHTGVKYWQEYRDWGDHYCGYFNTSVEVSDQDREIYEHLVKAGNLLKDFEEERAKRNEPKEKL